VAVRSADFWVFGEALVKEQVHCNPVTEPERSQNPKGPLSSSIRPDGDSISLSALARFHVPTRYPWGGVIHRKSKTSRRNSSGWSACSQWPASGMVRISAAGKHSRSNGSSPGWR